MEILNQKAFVITDNGDIGLAQEGTFAASAWLISDEAFNSISGRSFSWVAPDGGQYTDNRQIFSRPTEEQIKSGLSPRLKEIAVERGLIKL